MWIHDSDASTLTAARNERALSDTFKRDNDPIPRRGPVNDIEDVAQRTDDATTQVERAETLALQVRAEQPDRRRHQQRAGLDVGVATAP